MMTISSTVYNVRNAFLVYIFTWPVVIFVGTLLWEFLKVFYFLILCSTLIKINFALWTLLHLYRLTLFLTASALEAKLTLACRLEPSTQPRPDFLQRLVGMDARRRTMGQPWSYGTVLGYWRMRMPAILLVTIIAAAMLLAPSSGALFWVWVPLSWVVRLLVSAVFMYYLHWIECPALDTEYKRMITLRWIILNSVNIRCMEWLVWLMNAFSGEQIVQREDDWEYLETRHVDSRMELENFRQQLPQSEEARDGTFHEPEETRQLVEKTRVVDEALRLMGEEVRKHIE